MSDWTSCHTPHTWILFALWFKTALKNDFVVMLHVLQFQVQMSNWTSCHTPHTWILFALWFKTALQNDFVVILHVLHFQVKKFKLVWNFLSQSTHIVQIKMWVLVSFKYRSRYWYRSNTDVGIGIVQAQMWVSVLVSISTIKIFSIGTGIGIVKPRVGYWYRYWYRK